MDKSKASLTYHVRPMVKADLDQVIKIEKESMREGWRLKDFMFTMSKPEFYNSVCDVRNSFKSRVAGFVVVNVLPQSLLLMNMAVAPSMRKMGIGSAMMFDLSQCLARGPRRILDIPIREGNLELQKFMRRIGKELLTSFSDSKVTCAIEKKYFEKEDAFMFRFAIPKNAGYNSPSTVSPR